MARTRIAFAVVAAAAAIALAAWWSRGEPEPPAAGEGGDSGMTRQQTEEFMRRIGYVQ